MVKVGGFSELLLKVSSFGVLNKTGSGLTLFTNEFEFNEST